MVGSFPCAGLQREAGHVGGKLSLRGAAKEAMLVGSFRYAGLQSRPGWWGASPARSCKAGHVGGELPLRGAAKEAMLLGSFRCAGLQREACYLVGSFRCVGGGANGGRLIRSFRCAGLQREACRWQASALANGCCFIALRFWCRAVRCQQSPTLVSCSTPQAGAACSRLQSHQRPTSTVPAPCRY